MSAPDAKRAKIEMEEDPESLEVQKYQDQIEELNEKASEEILKVEQKYNKQRKPLFIKRQEAILRFDKSNGENENFWAVALKSHPFLAPMMSQYEHDMMSSLKCIEVIEDEDIKSGFSIKFDFDKNEYFTNSTIIKKYHMNAEGEVINTTTPITWKPKADPCQKEDVESEFTEWLQENTEDTIADDIADLIKDDLWLNTYQYYLGLDEEAEEDEENDENEA